MTGGTAPRLTASDRRQRLRPGYRPAQGAIFVQVAEHLDADGLVQAADADRFEPAGADQAGDQVTRGGVVRGVELHRALGLPPGGRGMRAAAMFKLSSLRRPA